MSKREIKDYLQDILEAMNAAESFIEGMSFEDFQQDRKTIFAVTRAIEIIGEAAKSIPLILLYCVKNILKFPGEVLQECAIS